MILILRFSICKEALFGLQTRLLCTPIKASLRVKQGFFANLRKYYANGVKNIC